MKQIQNLLLALAVLLGVLAIEARLAERDLPGPSNGFLFKTVPKISEATEDKPTLRFSRLKHIKGATGQRSAISALNRAALDNPSAVDEPYQNISTAGGLSTQYAIQCGWDGVPVWLVFDTGSSDTWAVKDGFECEDMSGEIHSQSACAFSKPYIGSFGHGPVNNIHFFIRYGSGEEVWGPMGYSDISCGGMSVSKQQVGLANHTYWHGNNATVGILGLAYPSITSAFYGKIGDEALWNAATYTPFLTTAVSQGSMDPIFSVAIMKNSSDGVLAWGGLPPIPYDAKTHATTDLIIVS